MPQRKIKIVWTKRIYDFFCWAGKLNKFQQQVLQSRIDNMTLTQMQFYHKCSKSTLTRTIDDIMTIYDAVQKQYPQLLQPRWQSEQQKYMNNH